MVLFGQKWLYSAKLLYSGKIDCIRAKCFYSGKVLVFGESGCMVVFMVVFGQKFLFMGKTG